ncbi:MAG: sodium:calcium symporter [Candidatus Omnitrophica bacterium CG11_big_fil_rev_8_21_14_0_20_64_10]|nr:MAG: sodium:calcium symporter [Candidatus Omnitrophica bacterium CG11_big_fil_rev_8_21_14_0_20_64_10]
MAKGAEPRIRDSWGSRLGVILAVAGSAVGLGNFLRFPVQAANNGGGAFMIPYFVSLLLLGIPLMWVEWTIGRYGGLFGHGSAPGIFHSLYDRNRFVKYFGVIGIFGPLVIYVYYVYIESWLLAYAVYALTGAYQGADQAGMQAFLRGYQGIEQNRYFSGVGPAYLFFLITAILNMVILSRGIRHGIERLCKIAMPLLFAFAVVIAVRVLTFGAPDPARPDFNPITGLGFLWNPDFSALWSGKVWLAAAGQVFFTLSVGFGIILTYASYLSRNEDVALSGLASVSTNEFAEVVLGGSIVIPAACVFFGPLMIAPLAASGAFNLGFVTMPLIFQQIPLGALFAFLWFALLFLAGLTSSVSMLQPAIAFIEDEFRIPRKYVAGIVGLITFAATHPVIFFLGQGVLDELDFWAGTVGLVVFGTAEVILVAWIFGMEKVWKEIHEGADIRVPKIFKPIIQYVTPIFLLVILAAWFAQDWIGVIRMEGVAAENKPVIIATRVALTLLFGGLCWMVHLAWKKRKPARVRGGKR